MVKYKKRWLPLGKFMALFSTWPLSIDLRAYLLAPSIILNTLLEPRHKSNMSVQECQYIVNAVIPSCFPAGANLVFATNLRRKIAGGMAHGLVVELHAWQTNKSNANINMRDAKLIEFLKKLAERGTGHEDEYEGIGFEFVDSEYLTSHL